MVADKIRRCFSPVFLIVLKLAHIPQLTAEAKVGGWENDGLDLRDSPVWPTEVMVVQSHW